MREVAVSCGAFAIPFVVPRYRRTGADPGPDRGSLYYES